MGHTFQADSFSVSTRGRRRLNQDLVLEYVPRDSWTLTRKGALFAVADGLGGHNAGQIASHLALQTLLNAYYADPDEDPGSSLQRAMAAANYHVWEQAARVQAYRNMRTTLVAVVIHRNQVIVANVGDSRAYLVRGRRLWQITQDHSYGTELAAQGVVGTVGLEQGPWGKLLSRAIGSKAAVRVDLFSGKLQNGDALLLCTDGLSDFIHERTLSSVLTHAPDLESAAQRLVNTAYQLGSMDNITAQIVTYRTWRGEVAPSADKGLNYRLPGVARGEAVAGSQVEWVYFWTLAYGLVLLAWIIFAVIVGAQ